MWKQQSSPYTVPSWLKWCLLILSVILLLVLTFGIWMYININQDRTSGHDEAIDFAKQQTGLTKFESVTTYYGEGETQIVQGTNGSGDEIIVFIDLEENIILDEISAERVLPSDQMRSQWKDTCSECEFKDIQYGYEEDEPVYQLTYIDSQNRYVLDYFTLEGEAFDQRFAFRQND
ncbi:DUF5590 domain-containing protein [Halobacillus dabanensis]|nr:DUF5590 domain-containing protein [Halobacillus dabanensis]